MTPDPTDHTQVNTPPPAARAAEPVTHAQITEAVNAVLAAWRHSANPETGKRVLAAFRGLHGVESLVDIESPKEREALVRALAEVRPCEPRSPAPQLLEFVVKDYETGALLGELELPALPRDGEYLTIGKRRGFVETVNHVFSEPGGFMEPGRTELSVRFFD